MFDFWKLGIMCLDADGGGAGGGGEGDKSAADKAAADKAATDKKDGDGKDGDNKTYTQEEVNGLLARKQAEGVDKLLKDNGLDNSGTLKQKLARLKEFEDKGKSEAELAAAKATEAETGKSKAEKERDAATAENWAMKKGVDPKKADKFVKIAMAYDGDTIEAKVAAALEEFPEFKTAEGPDVPNLGTKVKNQATPEADRIKAQVYEGFGLKAK